MTEMTEMTEPGPAARGGADPDGATDARRVRALERYDALGEVPRRDLEAVVELVAGACAVPMASINLLTATHQHQVATYGFDAAICAREDSMCNVVLADRTTVAVPDAAADPRFVDNPFVTGVLGDVRFYASHPLTTPEGVVIGRLCVFDVVARELDASQQRALAVVADRVVEIFELAVRTRHLAAALEREEEMREDLLVSNERLAAFAGQISHDLKTPLSSLLLSLELMVAELADAGPAVGPRTSREVAALAERALGSARRMAGLVDDVLEFALVGASPTGPVDLAEVLDQVREDLGHELTGVPVLADHLPTVTGDAVQLRSLLQNLLANAARFRDPARDLVVQVHATRLDRAWHVEVADNGRGIAPEDLERVFAPLVRADRSVPGSGIGLATCRRVVEAHGGRIGLRRGEPHGTVAWFELPD